MLLATEKEVEHVRGYMRSQASDLSVEFLQKVYSEMVGQVRHDIWDVHTDGGRWWVMWAFAFASLVVSSRVCPAFQRSRSSNAFVLLARRVKP